LIQYDSDLEIVEDKLKQVNGVDKDFYITAEYILKLAHHSRKLFQHSEYEESLKRVAKILNQYKTVAICIYLFQDKQT